VSVRARAVTWRRHWSVRGAGTEAGAWWNVWQTAGEATAGAWRPARRSLGAGWTAWPAGRGRRRLNVGAWARRGGRGGRDSGRGALSTRHRRLREEANERRARPTFRMGGRGKALAAVALRLHQARVDDVCPSPALEPSVAHRAVGGQLWPHGGTVKGRAGRGPRASSARVLFIVSARISTVRAGKPLPPACACSCQAGAARRRIRRAQRSMASLLLAAPPPARPERPCPAVCWLPPVAHPSPSAMPHDPGPLPPTPVVLQTGPPRRATASAS
jgi:hypothetical protein